MRLWIAGIVIACVGCGKPADPEMVGVWRSWNSNLCFQLSLFPDGTFQTSQDEAAQSKTFYPVFHEGTWIRDKGQLILTMGREATLYDSFPPVHNGTEIRDLHQTITVRLRNQNKEIMWIGMPPLAKTTVKLDSVNLGRLSRSNKPATTWANSYRIG